MTPFRHGVSVVVALFVAFACVTATRRASAEDEDARRRAAESYRGAQAAFKRRDYSAAAAAFESAGVFIPHPAAFLAAADSWERAGELGRAADDCARALGLPNLESAAQKDGVPYERDARACLTKLSPRLATVNVAGAATLAIRIDGGAQVILPTTRRVKPGRHVFTITDLTTSESRSMEIVVGAGDEKNVDLTARSAPPPPSPAASAPPANPPEEKHGTPPPTTTSSSASKSSGVPTAAWVAFGVGAAGAVVTGVSAALLLDARSSYQAAPTPAGRDAFFGKVVLTDVALGVTAAALVAGVVLWLVLPNRTTAALTSVTRGTLGIAWR